MQMFKHGRKKISNLKELKQEMKDYNFIIGSLMHENGFTYREAVNAYNETDCLFQLDKDYCSTCNSIPCQCHKYN